MKVILRLVFLCQIASLSLNAQAPQKFSFQTVIRNSGNQLLTNQQVGMKISIRQGSESGNSVYAERHTPTTNANGLASLQIGSGTVLTGNFTSIDWAQGPYFIATETDPGGGTNYSIVATQQLLSVPYALYAENSGSSAPGPQGPAGPTGAQGPAGANGQTTVTKTTPEGAGINCADGGVKLEFGFDTNGNGILDENEVNAALSRYVCNGSGSTIAAGNGIAINGDTITNTSVSPWLSGDSSIYYLNGKVGIGTSTPQAQLETTGDIVVNSVRIGRGVDAWSGFNSNTILGANSLMNINSGGNTAIGSNTLKNTTGALNTALGVNSLENNTIGWFNIAIGPSALFSNNAGEYNTAIGVGALSSCIGDDPTDVTTSNNIAIGHSALGGTYYSSRNIAIGHLAMYDAIGFENVAIGNSALANLSGGNCCNVAIGTGALENFTSIGSNNGNNSNTAVGFRSLGSNTNGTGNCAIGNSSLYSNISGNNNVAIGDFALHNNTVGFDNVVIGNGSWNSNTNGYGNTALGNYTDGNGSYNTAIGFGSGVGLNSGSDGNTTLGCFSGYGFTSSNDNVSSLNNTFIGFNSSPLSNVSMSNSTGLGYDAKPQESNEIRLGNYAVQSISGVVNFTTYSDKRYKRRVEEDVPGLDFITRLRPVTYNLDVEGLMEYNSKNSAEKRKELGTHELDVSAQMATKYSGFIAQEVEQAAKAINYSFSGIDAPANKDGLYGLRYSDFIIPMVKSIQELNTMLNDYAEISKQQQKKIEELQKEINTLKKRSKSN